VSIENIKLFQIIDSFGEIGKGIEDGLKGSSNDVPAHGQPMGLASLPVTSERKRLWTALEDFRPGRPMMLFGLDPGRSFCHHDELQHRSDPAKIEDMAVHPPGGGDWRRSGP
jgi:hypothetical protein